MFFKVLQKNTFSHKKIKIYWRVPQKNQNLLKGSKIKKIIPSLNNVANGGVPFTVHLSNEMLANLYTVQFIPSSLEYVQNRFWQNAFWHPCFFQEGNHADASLLWNLDSFWILFGFGTQLQSRRWSDCLGIATARCRSTQPHPRVLAATTSDRYYAQGARWRDEYTSILFQFIDWKSSKSISGDRGIMFRPVSTCYA